MNEKEIKNKLRAYLTRSLKEYNLKDEENFVDLGLVHSLFIMQLIMYVEKTFRIELDEYLNIDEMRTINDIYKLIQKKLPMVVEN